MRDKGKQGRRLERIVRARHYPSIHTFQRNTYGEGIEEETRKVEVQSRGSMRRESTEERRKRETDTV